MNWEGRKVLGIGPGAGIKLREALAGGASVVEAIKVSPGDSNDPADELVSWAGRKEAQGSVVLRPVAAEGLNDEGEWDDVVLSNVPGSKVLQVLAKAQRALKPDGSIHAGKEIVAGGFGDFVQPAAHASARIDVEPSSVMLHVHNVQRCGGTGNFVYDMARCFPEFQHTALCVNDPSGDQVWVNDVSSEMRTMYAPRLTRELLAEINPRVVVLHATVGARLEGDWPYDWIQGGGKHYVIAVHHIPTYPLLPADLDVFVSKYIEGRYSQFLPRMKAHIFMPPCTDMAPYRAVKNTGSDLLLGTTGGKHCAEFLTFSNGILKAQGWRFDSKTPGRLGAMPTYFSRFQLAVVWSGHQETWCRTVTEAMAAGCLVVAHRAGAIPEQITSGENGYLFDNGEELVRILGEVRGLSQERRTEIAQAGREWALGNVGFERMRAELYPFLTQAALRRG